MSGVDPGFEGVRVDYDVGTLDVGDVVDDPLVQLRRWIDEATAVGALEPTAMTVGTLAPDGTLRSRTVLMRTFEPNGLVFYTNTGSDKAEELAADPRCTAHFLWHELRRQVRVVGRAEPVSDELADAYFATRPRPSRIGAWASPQSRTVSSRAEIESMVAAVEERFAGVDDIPRPPDWGGFRVVADVVEFWQGRRSRLHDRLRYRRDGDGDGWVIERLAP